MTGHTATSRSDGDQCRVNPLRLRPTDRAEPPGRRRHRRRSMSQCTTTPSSPVSRLVAESLTGQLSRREILRARHGAGFERATHRHDALRPGARRRGAGCHARAGGTGSTIVVPEGLRTDLGGARSRVIFGADGPVRPVGRSGDRQVHRSDRDQRRTRPSGEQSATDRLASTSSSSGRRPRTSTP